MTPKRIIAVPPGLSGPTGVLGRRDAPSPDETPVVLQDRPGAMTTVLNQIGSAGLRKIAGQLSSERVQ